MIPDTLKKTGYLELGGRNHDFCRFADAYSPVYRGFSGLSWDSENLI